MEEWTSNRRRNSEKIIKIIDLMPKKFKKAQRTCQCHLFSLKPEPKQTVSARSLNLSQSFCSQNTEGEPNLQRSGKCLEAPVYNNDGSFASPAFTLSCDKSYYLERRNKMLDEHELRFAHYTDQKSELNVPKPKSKNCYCSVCRQYYEDYLDHVQSIAHKNKIISSPFSKYIEELTRTFSHHRPLKISSIQHHSPPQKSIIIEDISDDSDQVEIISNPQKKIKTLEITITKESNNQPSIPSKAQQQVQQPYYPFSTWNNCFTSQNQANPFNALPYNFNLNYNPFNFSHPLQHHLPPPISPASYQPFFMPRQGFQMLGLGAMPGV